MLIQASTFGFLAPLKKPKSRVREIMTGAEVDDRGSGMTAGYGRRRLRSFVVYRVAVECPAPLPRCYGRLNDGKQLKFPI